MAGLYNRQAPYDAANAKVERLHTLLAQLICKEALPFKLVDSPAFHAFVRELDPRYVLPTRQTLSDKLVPDLQHKLRTDAQSQLQQSASHALTTDMWTSVNQQAVMGVTAHLLTEDFTAINKCLAIKPAPGSHTAEFISAELDSVIDDWSLNRKSLHMVTDSGANVKKAVGQIRDIVWRPCFAHTLQLCVNGALTSKEVSELPKILAKARAIVGHFRRSPMATTQLEKAQSQLNLPIHKLQQDCPTRWNSQVRKVTKRMHYPISFTRFFR